MIWTRLAGYATAILAIVAALWALYGYIEQQGYDRCKAEIQAEQLELAIAYAQRITKAEGERDANQAIIDRYVAESKRVQIHIPSRTATGTQDQNRESWMASARIDGYMAEAKSAIDTIGRRCAEMNLDAIKMNSVNR